MSIALQSLYSQLWEGGIDQEALQISDQSSQITVTSFLARANVRWRLIDGFPSLRLETGKTQQRQNVKTSS